MTILWPTSLSNTIVADRPCQDQTAHPRRLQWLAQQRLHRHLQRCPLGHFFLLLRENRTTFWLLVPLFCLIRHGAWVKLRCWFPAIVVARLSIRRLISCRWEAPEEGSLWERISWLFCLGAVLNVGGQMWIGFQYCCWFLSPGLVGLLHDDGCNLQEVWSADFRLWTIFARAKWLLPNTGWCPSKDQTRRVSGADSIVWYRSNGPNCPECWICSLCLGQIWMLRIVFLDLSCR